MDSVEKLASAITLVEEARGVPLSASCVVHRGEMLELLDEARAALPPDFESAQKLLSARDAIIEEGRLSAEQMISMAREDVARMVEQTSIVQLARDEARKVLDDAREQAMQEKAEVEEYIVCKKKQRWKSTSMVDLLPSKLFSIRHRMQLRVGASA